MPQRGLTHTAAVLNTLLSRFCSFLKKYLRMSFFLPFYSIESWLTKILG